MVFGLFVLVAGLASMFFMFNTGQLVHDKGKLVNTADAVAYSAGVMHARALNYAAYTNRALLANEMTVAHVVSVASWLKFADRHALMANAFNCRTPYSLPLVDTMARYALVCTALAYAQPQINQASTAFDSIANPIIGVVEASKLGLQAGQAVMLARMIPERQRVMQEVANANFRDDGAVEVEILNDDYTLFDGAPLLRTNTGDRRARFADAARQSASRDEFMNSRRWRDESLVQSCIGTNGIRRTRVDRAGGTSLIGLDEWKAVDSASRYRYRHDKRWRCVQRSEQVIAGGRSAAFRSADVEFNNTTAFGRSRAINPRASRSAASSGDWRMYTGLPTFLSLSDRAQAYSPTNANPDRREINVRFSVRLTRRPTEIRNSEGRSLVRSSSDPVHGVNNYRGAPLRGRYTAVSTSEVFFDRPSARQDGRTELANAFNPYWQVRLVRSEAAIAAATALQVN
jgi:hypothetical protein